MKKIRLVDELLTPGHFSEEDIVRRKFSFFLSFILVLSLFLMPAGRASALTNLVQDPSLEAAIASMAVWAQSSTNSDSPLCTLAIPECQFGANSGARTGSAWALFGGIDWTDSEALSPEVGGLYQFVTFPNSCSATLQFYFWIGQAPAGSDASDVFTAKIDGTPVFTANATQKTSYPSYTLVKVSANSFANGASHKVEFSATTTGQTVVFNLDDVSVTDTCFKISGNAGLSGVTLNYTGGSTSSNGIGDYSFKVPSGWSGTLTPSKPGYLFFPASKTFSNVSADMTGQDFTAVVPALVTNANDSGAGSLRQTILDTSSGGAITFDSSLSGQTITLSSELLIDKDLIIDGSSLASKISISGNNTVRVFSVNPGATVSLNGLSIKNGRASGGGGIGSGGTLTVTNSLFSDNNAVDEGGAIYMELPGALSISTSVFNNNNAVRGGAIICIGQGSLTVTNSTFTSNDAPSGFGDGGAIFTTCNSTVTGSTFSGNTASNTGGALTADNDTNAVILTNNTIYGNTAPAGGGIANFGKMTVTHSTFSHNQSTSGGAIRNGLGGTLSLRNSILANSIGDVDCSHSDGAPAPQNINNLIESTAAALESCGTSLLASDPRLSALTSNGGPTQTMTLTLGSPAINAANASFCPATDQRGVARPQAGQCDLGAYESNNNVHVSIGGSGMNSYLMARNQNRRVSFEGANNGPVRVQSSDGSKLVASERVAYSPDGGTTWTSYSELMGMPANLATPSYTFPWYNNADLNTQLRFANAGNASTNVTVIIAGQIKGTYSLLPNQSSRVSYAGLNAGPVVVQSSAGVPIIASERVAYFDGSAWTSFSELMGLPATQLTTNYLFPWYNNVDLDTQLRFGNVGTVQTTVTVTMAGQLKGTYQLMPNQSLRVKYPTVNAGPVKVSSTGNVPIIASMRVAYTPDNGATWPEFSEIMGMPLSTLSTSYSFPVYNNVDLNTQLRFGNVGNALTTVTVTIGGVVKGTFNLSPNASQRVSYPVNGGPVVISSSGGVPIIASMRVAYYDVGLSKWTSFAEWMGLPKEQLTSTYLFPWYNNVDLNTQMRFGIP